MAVPIPQVIDGSLKFDSSNDNHLTRTLSSNGSTAATFSFWFKKGNQGAGNSPAGYESFVDAYVSSATYTRLYLNGSQLAMVHRVSDNQNNLRTNAVFRDIGWYHVVGTSDSNGHPAVYVNGVQITSYSSSDFSNTQSSNAATTSGATVEIATQNGRTDRNFDGQISNFYFIDGQALGPEYFGFTDGLTNTWKPKKYTGTFGTNGFWLPMDGNSPIGKDQSGNGNDWTPVNLGGSVELDSPQVSGARPILNTIQGGSQAGVGVFGSKQNVGYAVTVYNDGGGNKYYIDGVKQDTVTGLIRGATYTFDTSDSTVSSHPFRFSATSNGSHGGGSEYTNGVAAITGAATTITVPHDAPNTLYYYCTSHSGMGADITGITTNEKLADQYASSIVLALPLVGANSDASASIACTMTNKAITSNGDAAASNEQSNFYAGSFEFDGTGDTLTAGSSSDFTMGTGDFTIECFALKTTANHKGIFQISDTSGGLKSSSYGDTIAVGARTSDWQIYGAGTNTESSTYNIVANVWYHIAYVRSSGTSKLYVNGIEVISKSNDTTNYNGTYLVVGGYYSSSYLHDGYIQDFRIYKGVAKYTSNFVVPSRSPDILPDTPSGVSGGSKLTKITGGSVYFAGGNNGPDISWTGTIASTFTLDLYLYVDGTQSAGAGPIFLSDGTDGLQLDLSGSNLIRMEKSGGGSDTGFQPLTGGWNHVRCVVEGTSAEMFINGKSSGTCAPAGGTIGPATLYIGTKARLASSVWFKGYMCNVRIIEAALTGRDSPVIENGIIASSEGGTSAIFLWPGVNSVTENTGSDGDSLTATSSPVLTNFNPFNTDINTVRGQETGYATLNPLNHIGNGTLSNGNLEVSGGTGAYHGFSTIGVSSGKWYAEIDCLSGGSASNIEIGIVDLVQLGTNDTQVFDAFSRGFGYRNDGYKITNNTATSYGATYSGGTNAGDNISMAVDLDNGTLTFYKNGVSQGTAFTGIPSGYTYHLATFVRTSSDKVAYNFGQKPFKFPPPDGFQTLNNANTRPVNVISRPDQYVGVATYNGNGSAQSINLGFKPDFVWFKNRGSVEHPSINNSVRGANIQLESSRNVAETTHSNVLTSFDFSGFTVGSSSAVNENNVGQVAWAWKAGGNKNTFNVDDVGYASAAAAGLTGGDITPVSYTHLTLPTILRV